MAARAGGESKLRGRKAVGVVLTVIGTLLAARCCGRGGRADQAHGAARRRRRRDRRRHVPVPPAEDRGLPRRLGRGAGTVVGLARRLRRCRRPESRDVRAAVARRPAQVAVLPGARAHAGLDRPLARLPGRNGGRDGRVLRDAADVGLPPPRHHPRDDAHGALEPVPQPRLPDRGGVPAHGARRGDGTARHRRLRRRRDPGRRSHRVRARPREQAACQRGRGTGRATRELGARQGTPRPCLLGGPSFERFRAGAGELLRRRWHVLTLSSLAGSLSVFLVLLVCLRALDVPASEVSAVEAFAAWSLVACSGRSRSRPAASASSSSG